MSDDTVLKKLKERIDGAQKRVEAAPLQEKASQRTVGSFLNVGADFIAGVLVGIGMGLVSDWMFDISPWGLISFFILGSAAGFLNVYRTLIHPKKGRSPDE